MPLLNNLKRTASLEEYARLVKVDHSRDPQLVALRYMPRQLVRSECVIG
jgi:hypothetical protein